MMKKRPRKERMTLKHIVGFRILVPLSLHLGAPVRSKFSPDPLPQLRQHVLTVLPTCSARVH